MLAVIIPTLKTRSCGPGKRSAALPQSNALGYWNNGMLEYWVWRMRSTFIKMPLIIINTRTSSAFHTQYSIFPSFHPSMGYLRAKPTPLAGNQSIALRGKIL
jgi:hypothetical protein